MCGWFVQGKSFWAKKRMFLEIQYAEGVQKERNRARENKIDLIFLAQWFTMRSAEANPAI